MMDPGCEYEAEMRESVSGPPVEPIIDQMFHLHKSTFGHDRRIIGECGFVTVDGDERFRVISAAPQANQKRP
jgi:hypothetical protein